MSEWFEVKVELRQGYAISPGLFNLSTGGLVRKVYARTFDEGGQMVGEAERNGS